MFNFYYFLFLSFFIFFGSILIFVWSPRNFILNLILVELLIVSINLLLISSSFFLDDLTGQIIAFLILTVAAAETAIGLSILIKYYENYYSLDFNSLKQSYLLKKTNE